MLTDEQKAAIRERAADAAKGNLSLIREKLPEVTLALSGDRLSLRTSFQGKEVGVHYFDLTKLLEKDYVQKVVVGFEGRVNAVEADFVAREAIKEVLLEMA